MVSKEKLPVEDDSSLKGGIKARDAMELLALGPAQFYRLLQRGELRQIPCHGPAVISDESICEYLEGERVEVERQVVNLTNRILRAQELGIWKLSAQTEISNRLNLERRTKVAQELGIGSTEGTEKEGGSR